MMSPCVADDADAGDVELRSIRALHAVQTDDGPGLGRRYIRVQIRHKADHEMMFIHDRADGLCPPRCATTRKSQKRA